MHEALNAWAFQRPGTHLVDELPQHILAFQGERVPLPRLATLTSLFLKTS